MADLLIEDFATHDPRNAAVIDWEADKAALDTTLLADTVALVMAYDVDTTPLKVEFDDPEMEPILCGEKTPTPRPLQIYRNQTVVAHTVSCLAEAGCSGIWVIGPTDAAQYDQVKREVLAVAPDAQVVPFQPEASQEVAKNSRYAEIYGVPQYVLDIAREAIGQTPGAARALISRCDQVRITPQHLQMLALQQSRHEGCPIATSWITWSRRLPLLITGTFLDDLHRESQSDPALPYPYRPVRHIDVCDVVFGEEKLAASPTSRPQVAAFFKDCKLSAIAAVHKAAELEKSNPDERETELKKLSDSDRALVESALCTRADLEKHAQDAIDDFSQQIAWAQSWGSRNRHDFPIFATRRNRHSLVFLDTAATAQRAQEALNAQHQFDYEENANVYRAAYDLSMSATISLNEARAQLEHFIGANRRETIYTQNTTGGANLIAQAWGDANIHPGDLIVTSMSEHHSNLLPWMLLARRAQARLALIPLDDAGRYDQAAYAEALAAKPRLVALAQASNVIGMGNPIEDMIAQAKAAGAVVFVDGAQGLPHVPTDVYALGCDFYAFSGHKLYGPMGIGGVWVHPDRLAEMRPVGLGGGAVSHVSTDGYYLRLGAIAYENGTPAVSQAIGLGAACDYLANLGMDQVKRHGQILTRYLLAGLADIPGISIWGDHRATEDQCGLISLNVADAAPVEVCMLLGKLGVAVRSGGHCALPLSGSLGVVGTTRISIGVYNTAEDIQAVLAGLRVIRERMLS